MPRPDDRPPAALHQTVLQGGALGAAAGATFAQCLSGDTPMIAFGTALGACTGLVIGLVTWVSTAELPDAPIPPVRGPTRRPITPGRGASGGAPGRPAGRRG